MFLTIILFSMVALILVIILFRNFSVWIPAADFYQRLSNSSNLQPRALWLFSSHPTPAVHANQGSLWKDGRESQTWGGSTFIKHQKAITALWGVNGYLWWETAAGWGARVTVVQACWGLWVFFRNSPTSLCHTALVGKMGTTVYEMREKSSAPAYLLISLTLLRASFP